VSIQDVRKRLRSRNRYSDFGRLGLQQETLEAEKAGLDAKIAEHKAVMRSIHSAMLCGTEEEVGVDVFGILKDGELDFARVHLMMLRECRRLKEGMPIYAYRQRILNHISSNKVFMDYWNSPCTFNFEEDCNAVKLYDCLIMLGTFFLKKFDGLVCLELWRTAVSGLFFEKHSTIHPMLTLFQRFCCIIDKLTLLWI
jgi:hypothetical protein